MDTTDSDSVSRNGHDPSAGMIITVEPPRGKYYNPDFVREESDETEPVLWEQWDGEPPRWYERFVAYMLMGPKKRSIRGCFKKFYHGRLGNEFFTPQRWYNASSDWQWAKRAGAWDIEQARLLAVADQEERLEARTQRRTLIRDLGEVFAEKIDDLRDQEITWRNASDLLKVVTETSRTEYDDLPAQKIENTVTIRLVQEVAHVFTLAFNEVNALPSPEERQEAFATKILELSATMVR